MPAQTSLVVSQGDTIRAQDHNRVVTDIAAIIAEKGAANGIAPLGADSKVPSANLPTFTPADGSIATSQLAANAVTKVTRTQISNTSTISTTSSSYVDISTLSMSVTTNGGDLYVEMWGNGAQMTSANAHDLAINVNGTDYPCGWEQGPAASTSITTGWRASVVVTGLPAGTYTVAARHKALGGNTSTILSGSSGTRTWVAALTAIEFKR